VGEDVGVESEMISPAGQVTLSDRRTRRSWAASLHGQGESRVVADEELARFGRDHL
jgi:hypothetical protein